MSDSLTTAAPRRMKRSDWDNYKDLIRRWYIGDRMTAKKIIEELKESYNFVVAPYELKERLAAWNLRKNLAPAEQAFVTHQGRQAKAVNGQLEYKIAGQSISRGRIQRLCDRRREPITLKARQNISSNNSGPYTAGSIHSFPFVVTDHDSPLPSTALALSRPVSCERGELYKWEPWPSEPYELPWIRFNRNVQLLDSIHAFLFADSSGRRLAFGCNFPQQFSHGPLDFAHSNVQRLAVMFSDFMPESREKENAARAKSLTKTWPELDMEMLKLVIFQLSNNFIEFDDYQDIIRLVELLGFGTCKVIEALFRVASEDLTVAAVLDKLFIAACKTLSADLVSILIEKNELTQCGSLADVLNLPLTAALDKSLQYHDSKLASAVLTSRTVSVAQFISSNGQYYLSSCAAHRDHYFANYMASLLISKGVDPGKRNQSGFPPLLGALHAGNISLVLRLIKSGVDIWANNIAFSYLIFNNPSESERRIRLFDFMTIYTAAVVPCCRFLMNTYELDRDKEYWDGRRLHTSRDGAPQAHELKQHRQRGEDLALQTYAFLEKKLLVEFPRPSMTAELKVQSLDPIDTLISAAFFGYPNFIETVTKEPRDLNRTNCRGMWPLLAAVLGGDTSTCNRLLKLGANPNFVPPCPVPSHPHDTAGEASHVPSVLHQAAFFNLSPIVALLINFGANAKQTCDATVMNEFHWNYSYRGRSCWWCNAISASGEVITNHRRQCITLIDVGPLTPLAIALWMQNLEVAKLLLKSAAQVGSTELYLAVQYGDHGFVEAVLPKLQDSKLLNCPFNGQLPLQLALRAGSGPTCDLFLFAGARLHLKVEDLPLAAKIGSTQIVLGLLQTLDTQTDQHYLSEALHNALLGGFPDLVNALVHRGAQLPRGWLSDAFRTYAEDDLLAILAGTRNLEELAQERSFEGRTLLEEAVLNRNPGIAKIAFDILPESYDSGALLASVCRTLDTDEIERHGSLCELLQRRRRAYEQQLDPVLENGAIALAAYFDKTDLMEILLERPQPEELAVIPGEQFWMGNSKDVLGWEYLPEELPFVITAPGYWLSKDLRKAWSAWHDAGRRIVSPILMAVKAESQDSIQKLIRRGYQPDSPTITAAVMRELPLSVVRQLVSIRSKYHLKSEIDTDFQTPIYAAVIVKSLEIAQLLTEHDTVGNGYFIYDPDDFNIARRGRYTGLQFAILNGCSDDMVYHLIRSGADVNAPARHHEGLTALQAAAAQGKITLARYLLERGANLNAPRALYGGRTCLEAAAENGRLDMIQFLLNKGVQTVGRGRVQYLHAFLLATRRGHVAVAKLLRRHRPFDIQDQMLLLGPHTYDSYYRSPKNLDAALSDSRFLCQDNGCRYDDFQGQLPDNSFLHPDEASLKERQVARQWCLENSVNPLLDAELDLLSNEELELPSSERELLLATILDRPEEIERRFNLASWLPDSYHRFIRRDEFIGEAFMVAASVLLLLQNSSWQTPNIRVISSSQDDDSEDCYDLDSDSDASPAEEIYALANDPEELVAVEESYINVGNGPTLRLHPLFNEQRDIVDFHEQMHEDTWV
ncbi:ankyrin [Xylariaceae sp. FL1651]|nr:ankyrin [Xylariaceae sp. FL1651]